ncbi:ABC transporter permease [Glaciihabitans sp. INWT7]|uniref:ABC transporter permease n=1 Tax=Glaciihabitans sp. INWT7 TaxID=2596912 RepID=UPI0016289BAF|nr:ABC transporter permease [Glaciihabitans sp. INWT7]QNE46272.1 ABC transporter permease [Glaciihabitans sp. INWT7]
MRTIDVIGTAIENSFRSKLRTTLTVIAIFIGAFTLTITNGLGTGINDYINSTVAAIGAQDVLTVTKVGTDATTTGPKKYNPDLLASSAGRPGSTVQALTPSDISTITALKGVKSVQPTLSISPNYIQIGSGTKYALNASGAVPGIKLQLAAGAQPSSTSGESQIVVAKSYVKALGLSSNSAAIGTTVKIGVTDAAQKSSTVEATIVGISDASLGAVADAATTNSALTQKLFDTQSVGLTGSAKDRYSQASVRFDSAATPAEVTQLKDRLTKAGYDGQTVADQIGTFKTVIDAIVLVLNAFAVIALLAASFGIVNTLLMSVQERTKEIGLMKAMGMGGGKVFGLFSFEAVFIGFLGSAIGAGIAILVGSGVSAALSGSVFSALPGLTLIAFSPASIATIILVVMAIAFVAGTLPAAKAARQDPIESLRYE